MAMIRKNEKTGKWYYRLSYKKEDGTFSSKYKGGFSTKKEAEIKAAETSKLYSDPDYRRKKELEKSFADYFWEWVTLYKPSVRQVTKKAYIHTHTLIKSYFGNTPLKHIDSTAYVNFINWYGFGKVDARGNYINQPHAKESVKKLHVHCRACFKHAFKLKHVETNPTDDIKPDGAVAPKLEKFKFLNEHEQQLLKNELLNNWEPKYVSRLFILVSLSTGLRFSECNGLTWDCVDWDKKSLKINKTWSIVDGTLAPTKNDGSTRVIGIDDYTLSLLSELRKWQLKNKVHFRNLVFIDKERKPKTNNAINKVLRRSLKRANVKTVITHHGLRHSHISWLLYKNVNIKWISKRAGHSDVSITLNTYSHILDELDQLENKKVINLIEQSMRQKKASQ